MATKTTCGCGITFSVTWHQNLVKTEQKRTTKMKNLNFHTLEKKKKKKKKKKHRMLETRDLKLFGKTITLSSITEDRVDQTRELHSITSHSEESKEGDEETEQIADKDLLSKRLTENEGEDNQNPRTPSFEKETVTTKSSRTEDDQSETSGSEEKTILKKPDEILPCPRCNSMNTKFCYYNNYNVNQPRHFCKNCQRYWTAGGTMRNVPVGAGRRKNKNSALNYRHITMSEAFQMAQSDALDGVEHPILKSKGSILTFGPADPVICDSMASVLNLADRARNGFHRQVEDSIRPAVRVSSSGEARQVALRDIAIQNGHGFPPQMSSFQGPLPYPWNPAMCPPHFPIPFYPATTYWNCPVPGTWGHPWMFPPFPSSHQGPSMLNPDSPPSGKRSRDGEMRRSHIPEKNDQGESNSDRGVWTPKTFKDQ